MLRRMTVSIFIVVLLSGCATMRKNQEPSTSELQDRVSNLETEFEKMKEEIIYFKSEDKTAQINFNPKSENKSMNISQVSTQQIQAALKNAGFYQGTVDGKMGPKTKEAIRSFQLENGLKSDGVVGKKTWERLSSHIN